MISRMLHDDHQAQPGLLGSRDDLAGRKHEAVAACVPQLKRERIFNALFIGPVDGSTTSLVCIKERGSHQRTIMNTGLPLWKVVH